MNHQPNVVVDSFDLKQRVMAIRKTFPKGMNYTFYYQKYFGKKSKKELQKVRNVWNMRNNDESIISNLEEMSKKMKDV